MSINTLSDAMQLSRRELSTHVLQNPDFWARPEVIFPFILAHNILPERISLENRLYPVAEYDGRHILIEGWVGQTLFIHQQEAEIKDGASSLCELYLGIRDRMLHLSLLTRASILSRGNVAPPFAAISETGIYNTLGQTMLEWFQNNPSWIRDEQTARAIIADQNEPFQQRILTHTMRALIRAGNHSDLERLIHFGIDINMQEEGGMTPLMIACENNQPLCIHLLVERGANTRIRDENGDDAHFYCFNNPYLLTHLNGLEFEEDEIPDSDDESASMSSIGFDRTTGSFGSDGDIDDMFVVPDTICNE